MSIPPEPKELTPEELQALDWIKENGDRFQTYTIEDGKAVVVIDEERNRAMLSSHDLAELIPLSLFDLDDDDKELLTSETQKELADKKLYGKNEIMELLQCGNQKALNFLKLLYQMKYAINIVKSYLVRAEDFDRFFEDFKGQEIVI